MSGSGDVSSLFSVVVHVCGVVFGGVLLFAPHLWVQSFREYGPAWLRESALLRSGSLTWVRVLGGLMMFISLVVLWAAFVSQPASR